MPKEWKARMNESMKKPEDYQFSEIDSRLFTAELGEPPELDLHGDTPNDAINRLEIYLYSQQKLGTDAVRIIHGRGSGKLRKKVTEWLSEQKKAGNLVEDFRGSNKDFEQNGVILVALTSLR